MRYRDRVNTNAGTCIFTLLTITGYSLTLILKENINNYTQKTILNESLVCFIINIFFNSGRLITKILL